ncbi:MAG: tetratricopeptide repeat protein, partial [Nitrospinaceae bacterium]
MKTPSFKQTVWMRARRVCLSLFAVYFALSGPAWSLADPAALYKRGIVFSQNKNWAEAASEFQKTLEIDPNYTLAYANLGVALSNLDQHKEALLAFEEAMSLGYDHPFLRYNRGISFAKLNLVEEAVRELETALQMNSRMVKADYDLGILYLRQGRKEEARKQADKLYHRNNKLSKKLFEQIPPEYKFASVDNGGSVSGRVTLKGPIPMARPFHLIHAPNIEFCSRISDGKGNRLLFDFDVSDDRGLKDTVIFIRGVKKGKLFSKKVQTINISRCH